MAKQRWYSPSAGGYQTTTTGRPPRGRYSDWQRSSYTGRGGGPNDPNRYGTPGSGTYSYGWFNKGNRGGPGTASYNPQGGAGTKYPYGYPGSGTYGYGYVRPFWWENQGFWGGSAPMWSNEAGGWSDYGTPGSPGAQAYEMLSDVAREYGITEDDVIWALGGTPWEAGGPGAWIEGSFPWASYESPGEALNAFGQYIGRETENILGYQQQDSMTAADIITLWDQMFGGGLEATDEFQDLTDWEYQQPEPPDVGEAVGSYYNPGTGYW